MKNFKPSELPMHTVIKDAAQGTWVKDTPRSWFAIDGEEDAIVFDDVATAYDKQSLASFIVDVSADELFENFTILALPFEITRQLAVRLNDEIEHTSPEILIGGAIESFQRNTLQY